MVLMRSVLTYMNWARSVSFAVNILVSKLFLSCNRQPTLTGWSFLNQPSLLAAAAGARVGPRGWLVN
jgi:hypothetical protein